ncbi:hypothetical protein RC74_17110 [Falsihalocynthiibacter arcticus]|uniref:Uncharacterized protein n=1 Tax=Falsihalocynthiibacter arcticus TaxID=1579316 RepID=A0A126V4W9_9RHOB|nr:hypothetical protein RC74_17110 [Falsihalocynthiibacter arcticus]
MFTKFKELPTQLSIQLSPRLDGEPWAFALPIRGGYLIRLGGWFIYLEGGGKAYQWGGHSN